MTRIAFCSLIALANFSLPASAETVFAARTLRAQTIVGPADVIVGSESLSGFATSPDDVVGLETRIAIYQGRPIHMSDLGPPAIINRNQIIELRYRAGRLTITTEGRALGRAGVGERVRVMNISSRTNLFGTVAEDGSVWVQPSS